MPVAEQMTAAQFLAAPPAERGRPWNLVDGEVVLNEAGALHGHVQGNLFFALESWAREASARGHAVWPRDIAIDDLNVFAPDVLWYRDGRLPDPASSPPYAMPDLAVEVRSPSTWRHDLGAKKATYEQHGLSELWLVDTVACTVLAFRRSGSRSTRFDIALELGSDDRLTSPLLPGFSTSVAEVFRVR